MKFKEIQKLSEAERQKKLKALKMELVKAKVAGAQTGSSKIKEIKKIIARMLTLDSSDSLENKNTKEQT
ncbi:50S ribosomal protein L29 [Candidatus Pacearchaeota archaeon]|nr:50S ribosomal protein L29 [Candidatus Pacearchaeota archaeon]